MEIKIFANRDIRLPKVRVIDSTGANLGVLDTWKAMAIAQDSGLDLVQVAPPDKEKIPTCKIMDLGKHKFELSKKKHKEEKKQRETAIKTKELVFRFTTGFHDLEIKAEQAKNFLAEGCQVKVKVELITKNKQAKGRKIYDGNRDIGLDIIDTFISLIPGYRARFDNSENSKHILFTLIPE